MILRTLAVIVFALVAAALQFFTVSYGNWAEGGVIIATSFAALICAFFAGGLSALNDRSNP